MDDYTHFHGGPGYSEEQLGRHTFTCVTVGLSPAIEAPIMFSQQPQLLWAGQIIPLRLRRTALSVQGSPLPVLWSLWNQLYLGKPWPGINLAHGYSEISLTHTTLGPTLSTKPQPCPLLLFLCADSHWAGILLSEVIIVHGWNLYFKDDRRPRLGLC